MCTHVCTHTFTSTCLLEAVPLCWCLHSYSALVSWLSPVTLRSLLPSSLFYWRAAQPPGMQRTGLIVASGPSPTPHFLSDFCYVFAPMWIFWFCMF